MLKVLQITDGKRGHEIQVEGLLSAIERRHSIEIYRHRVGDKFTLTQHKFDVVIGAGSATHSAILWYAFKFKAKSIVLMKPKWPIALFSACVIPQHDSPPDRANVFASVGSLNNIVECTRADFNTGLILVGGPSKHVYWESSDIVAQINKLLQNNPDVQWVLSTSRRTPADFLPQLPEHKNLTVFEVDSIPSTWLKEQYHRVAFAYVSNDSVNMIYESLTAGISVGLLQSKTVSGSRVIAGVDALVAQGLVGVELNSCQNLPQAKQTFNEANRAAKWLDQLGVLA